MHLHIISFDIPYPANYGGVIDVFYKIKTLKDLGVKIILHCFEYGRSHSSELEALCEKVCYYKRNNTFRNSFSSFPFIVKSRNSSKLLDNLLKDDFPVLFEGHHCCALMNNEKLKGRFKLLRTHNVEHLYYHNLYKAEKNIFKKLYFLIESQKLRKFERSLKNVSQVACISENDKLYYQDIFTNVEVISAFHSNDKLNILEGKGNYALYHGNLGVGENNLAALFLVNEVFCKLNMPFYIAGNNPSPELREAIKGNKQIKIFDKVSPAEIDDLIRNAHVNVLPTFQATGIKLKLLNALHNGRFCLVNKEMVDDTGLEKYCIIKNNANDMANELKRLSGQEFTKDRFQNRSELLSGKFSNSFNGKKLMELIYSGINCDR